jgi:hypothetical protein
LEHLLIMSITPQKNEPSFDEAKASVGRRRIQFMHSLATFRVAVDVIVSACRAQFNLDLSVLT